MTTTAFSTRCCTRQADAGALRAWAAALLLLVLACLWPAAPAAAQGAAEVAQLRVERTEEDVLLSSQVVFELPPVIEDALEKGIPMHFVAEARILRERWYWTDQRVASAARYLRLSYQPLTRRWRLHVSSAPIGNSGLVLGQIFDTRDEAMAAVQRISRWRIADAARIDPDSEYDVDFRFRLDMSQLPRPIQIGAVGQSEWSLSASRRQPLDYESPK